MNAPTGAPRTAAGSALRALRSGRGASPAVAVASVAVLAGAVDRAAFAAVLESIRADLWLTDARLGGLFAAAVLSSVALGPPLASLSRRTRTSSRALAIAAAISAAGTILSGAARRGLALLGARVAAGAGPAGLAAVGARPISAAAAIGAPAVAGTAAGYAIAAVLSRIVGWRWTLAAAAVPGLLAAAAALRARGGDAAAAALPWRGDGGFLAELRRLREDRQRLLAVAGQGGVSFAAAAIAFWTPAFLERTREVPRAAAGVELGAVVLIAALGGTFAAARALERVRARTRAAERWVAGVAALAASPLAIAAYAAWRPRAYLASLLVAQLLVLAAAQAGAAAVAASTPATGAARAAAAAAIAIALFAEAPAAWVVGFASDRSSLGRALAVLAPLALALAGAAWIASAWREERAARGPGAPRA